MRRLNSSNKLNYLDFLVEVFFAVVVFFALVDADFLAQEDLVHFLESCSTAIDQKYSS